MKYFVDFNTLTVRLCSTNKYMYVICVFCISAMYKYIKSEILKKCYLQETGYSLNQLHRKLLPTEKILSISPSPSKLVKGDFRESDYESDDGRILSCHTVGSTKFNVTDSGTTY